MAEAQSDSNRFLKHGHLIDPVFRTNSVSHVEEIENRFKAVSRNGAHDRGLTIRAATIGNYGLGRVNAEVASMYEDRLIPVQDFVGLKADLMEFAYSLVGMLNNPDEAKLKKAQEQVLELSQNVDRSFDQYLTSKAIAPPNSRSSKN